MAHITNKQGVASGMMEMAPGMKGMGSEMMKMSPEMMKGMMGSGMMGSDMMKNMMGSGMMGSDMMKNMMGSEMMGMGPEMMKGMMGSGMGNQAARETAKVVVVAGGSRARQGIIGSLIRNPVVLIGLGFAAGYLIYKYRKDITSKAKAE